MAAETTALTAPEARAALAKRESQLANLRDRLRSIAEESQAASTLVGHGLAIGAGATAAGALDRLVLGQEGFGTAEPLMRPSTVAGAALLGVAVAMGSPTLAMAAGGMWAPGAYLKGAQVGATLSESLGQAKAAAAAAKAAA